MEGVVVRQTETWDVPRTLSTHTPTYSDVNRVKKISFDLFSCTLEKRKHWRHVMKNLRLQTRGNNKLNSFRAPNEKKMLPPVFPNGFVAFWSVPIKLNIKVEERFRKRNFILRVVGFTKMLAEHSKTKGIRLPLVRNFELTFYQRELQMFFTLTKSEFLSHGHPNKYPPR